MSIKLKVEKTHMKQKELLKEVAQRTELTQGKVKEVYKATADVITEENMKGRKLVIPHIGTFKPKYRAAGTRNGMLNPQTKERGPVKVSESYSIAFKADSGTAREYCAKGLEIGLIKTHGVEKK